jgi:membrane protease YdiL (CAAX protease family)
MVPYFGLIHPVLEQIHWAPLRQSTPASHVFFAGYHVVVLYSLLTIPWLVLCFVVLATASLLWRGMTKRCGVLAAPLLSHILADLGIIIAAWLKT